MNTDTYSHFFSLVQESIKNKTFAKLTLAKTIGKPELQNIFVRTKIIDQTLQASVIFKIYNEGLQEIEKIMPLDTLENELVPYMNNPFMSALLFTIEHDIVLKLNKKRIANINHLPPTFKNADATLLKK
ncbi:hypothetical protein RF683_04340 [Flavobacterium sp. 20NA77.7]|uniref:Uncharacterized protein n=1 Tax=Flavobacterium nakdongensis TaxID=3073563 RepID=A0ABY9RBR9_9FLAO|nr:hypothetical protein [Flavobacterium sp. 20NA77.7]WMW78677.1 hypothetical protein RF683_04340 [Flavobacterium sp. 20NA77.7]